MDRKEYMKKWREENKEYLKSYAVSYEQKNKEVRKQKRLSTYKTKGTQVLCLQCSESFLANKSKLNIGKDKYCSVGCYNISQSKLRGDETPAWKGDDVKYVGLHMWISSVLGKPSKCEHCDTVDAKKFEWANKDHLYSRNINDWIRLCTSCHRKYDYNFNKQTVC